MNNTLFELTSVMRSKNAGPFMGTVDLFFAGTDEFDRVAGWTGLRSAVADRLDMAPTQVAVTPWRRIRAIKISFPRRIPSGSVGDADIYGCQLHVPLIDICVPELPPSPV